MTVLARPRTSRSPVIAVLASLGLGTASHSLAQLEEVIVTAQKRSENMQNVPIAITAFDAEALEAKQITNVQDLRFTAPNVSYSKGNFTGSNFKIRGIGQDLVAAGSDAGVGIHINDVPLQDARLYETEYYDIDQLIVLRGPQGTLYGRNSTGGAVNMITSRATVDKLAGNIEGQYGNHDTVRVKGMVNMPLGETLALRLAGISLQRDGYIDNITTGNDIGDRDQWSLRGSLAWLPSNNSTVHLMVSYTDENSSRTRSQKQLCHNDPSALLGCLPDKLAFDAVNPLAQLTGIIPARLGPLAPQPAITNDTSGVPSSLRKVSADTDPEYETDETLAILRFEHQFTRHELTFITGYHDTSLRSQQDYTMNSSPVQFFPSPLLATFAPITYDTYFSDNTLPISKPSNTNTGIVGGNILEASNSLDGYDISSSNAEQYSFEANLASNYDGPFNFIGGVFALNYTADNDYWVISNGLDYFSVVLPAVPLAAGGLVGIDGVGWVSPSFHNSTKKYELESTAVFGEIYYELNKELQFTLGARYTRDQKSVHDNAYLFNYDSDEQPIVQVFGADENVDIAFPPRKANEEWEEWTGRIVLDWSPDMSWSDNTLLYAAYSRGYKGGGFNPAFDPREFPDTAPTFKPEFVNAFELGTKNQMFGNRLQANLTAFYYDYKDLQISRIVNRTSFNTNTDAEIYGLESEFIFAPTENWLLNANVALLQTSISDYQSVDTRDPTQGSGGVTLIKDNTNASNCVIFHNGAAAPDIPQLNSCTDPTLTDGSPLPPPYAVGSGIAVDLNGNELKNSPSTTLSLGAQYSWDMNPVQLSLRVDYYWQDAMWGREFNRDPIDKIDSFDVWNAQATISSYDSRWYAKLYIKNITDSDALAGMFVSDPSSGLFTNVFPIEPRLYGVTLGYNF